jgi:hypothetical protein
MKPLAIVLVLSALAALPWLHHRRMDCCERKPGDEPSCCPGSCCTTAGFLGSYFEVWRSLAADRLEGIDRARFELTAALEAARASPPEGLGEADRARRAQTLERAAAAAASLSRPEIREVREAFGDLSDLLRGFVESWPDEADAYVVYCDMARRCWLEDGPRVLNPYYGASMEGCGKVIHEPGRRPAGR